ncbi:hypothetical protein [Capnocytophaga cynodegmi]|uniref:hypothetical protein n=1 Tax=Capnocytophaga cynodegmi TaxID=28189 RepID=UPI001C54D187|nr:hypothetical protein [Capnocytophaga cynodegmi]
MQKKVTENLCNSHKISIFVRALAQHSTAQHSTAQHSTAYTLNRLHSSLLQDEYC